MMITIAVIEEFYILFIGLTDESTTVIDLIFRHGSSIIKARKNGRDSFRFRTRIKDSRIDKLSDHVINTELKLLRRR